MLAKAMAVAPDVVDRVVSFVKGKKDGDVEEKVDKEINKAKKKAEDNF